MSHEKLRIAYVPYHNEGNAYVTRMQEVLSQSGTILQFIRPRQLMQDLRSGTFERYDVSIFNWSENDILDARSKKISVRSTLKVLLRFLYARATSRRLVFFRHNLYPHSTLARQEWLARKMLGCYERLFDQVFIHSGAHLEGRRAYCPHPLYRNTLAEVETGAPGALAHGDWPDTYFVMFGRVERYKKILELARRFPAERNLLIIGPAPDVAYSQELERLGRPNVFYRPGFRSEEEAQRIVARSAAVVLAHAGDNTVVSGSFFYAMSLLVPVLAVETPFLRWVAPRVGAQLLALAPDLDGLAAAAQGFASRPDLAHLRGALEREFGDQAIAAALAPALAAR